jgi:hypothetical protein
MRLSCTTGVPLWAVSVLVILSVGTRLLIQPATRLDCVQCPDRPCSRLSDDTTEQQTVLKANVQLPSPERSWPMPLRITWAASSKKIAFHEALCAGDAPDVHVTTKLQWPCAVRLHSKLSPHVFTTATAYELRTTHTVLCAPGLDWTNFVLKSAYQVMLWRFNF